MVVQQPEQFKPLNYSTIKRKKWQKQKTIHSN
jgi:hypothetical protein